MKKTGSMTELKCRDTELQETLFIIFSCVVKRLYKIKEIQNACVLKK